MRKYMYQGGFRYEIPSKHETVLPWQHPPSNPLFLMRQMEGLGMTLTPELADVYSPMGLYSSGTD